MPASRNSASAVRRRLVRPMPISARSERAACQRLARRGAGEPAGRAHRRPGAVVPEGRSAQPSLRDNPLSTLVAGWANSSDEVCRAVGREDGACCTSGRRGPRAPAGPLAWTSSSFLGDRETHQPGRSYAPLSIRVNRVDGLPKDADPTTKLCRSSEAPLPAAAMADSGRQSRTIARSHDRTIAQSHNRRCSARLCGEVR